MLSNAEFFLDMVLLFGMLPISGGWGVVGE